MYQRIWTDYLSRLKDVPPARTIYLGKAIRFIREENRKTRSTVAREAQIGLPLLKAIETKQEAYSTWQNITNLANTLDMPVEKLIQRCREEFPHNFFIQRKDSALRLEYEGLTVHPLSPPLSTQSDFLFLKVYLHPGGKMTPCVHPQAKEIACYVSDGPLKLRFGQREHEIKANQSCFFDGSIHHGFLNPNPSKTVEFFLCLNPPPAGKKDGNIPGPRKQGLDLAFALEYVRLKASPAPSMPLPWNMLSEMTGIPLRALMHLKSGKTEIVYWDKIEALAKGTGIPFDEIMSAALGKMDGRLDICNALYRGFLDYGDHFGLKIYSAVKPGTSGRKFFIGQLFLSKRAALPSMRRRWRYKTNAFIAGIVQDGRILVEYGARKKEKLTTGDSFYFDANIEFVIHNMEPQESKLFLFSQPPLF